MPHVPNSSDSSNEPGVAVCKSKPRRGKVCTTAPFGSRDPSLHCGGTDPTRVVGASPTESMPPSLIVSILLPYRPGFPQLYVERQSLDVIPDTWIGSTGISSAMPSQTASFEPVFVPGR